MRETIQNIKRQQPVNQQVETYFRSLIATGQWMPGGRVPSNQALAETTGTSVFTVQAALARLTKDGLLERKRRVGTFVKGGKIRLNCIGIYLGGDLWDNADAAFYRALHNALREKITALGLKARVWVDDRLPDERHRVFPPVKQAAEERDIQALLAPLTSPDEVQWLRKLPVPSALLTSQDVPYRVKTDLYSMVCIALKELRNMKCKKAAFISSISPGLKIEGPKGKFYDLFQCFADEAAKLSLKVRDSWVRFLPVGAPFDDKRQFGYDQFRALWDQPERPDGLFVFPDIAAIGVVTAVLATQVSIPKDLKLVLHANDQIPYLCPVPATFITTSIAEIADGLIEVIKAQCVGSPIKSPIVKMSVWHSKSGFPSDCAAGKD